MARYKSAPTQAFDKLGHEIKEGDIVAFVYNGLGADLRIGKLIQLKLCTRKGVRGLWGFCQIIGVSDKEYEDTQWCLPIKMLKLNEDMLNDVILAKLSTTPGKKENLNMIPMELINRIKQEFKDRGCKVNYRCKDFKQRITIEMIGNNQFISYEISDQNQFKRDAIIEEVFKIVGLHISKNSWARHYPTTIHVNR